MLFLVTGTVWIGTFASPHTRLVEARDWLAAVKAFKKNFEETSSERREVRVENNVVALPVIVAEE